MGRVASRRRTLAATSLWCERAQGAALAAWMRAAAQRAVEARGALHWAARGRNPALRGRLRGWRAAARTRKRCRVQLHLAARFRTHRAQFDAFVALADHSISIVVSAHRLAHACLQWSGPCVRATPEQGGPEVPQSVH